MVLVTQPAKGSVVVLLLPPYCIPVEIAIAIDFVCLFSLVNLSFRKCSRQSAVLELEDGAQLPDF
jgi:hypothetical protein